MGTSNAFRVIVLSGTIGVLVDIDHFIALFNGWEARFLHTPLLVASSIIILGLSTYLGGLFLRSILRR